MLDNGTNHVDGNITMFDSCNVNPRQYIEIERIKIFNPSTSKNYHYHDYYELYYLYSGERYYFVNDKTYHVKKGTVVLVKPYDVHYTSNYANHGYDRHLVWFTKDYIEDFLDMYGEGNLLECFHKDICIIKLNMQGQHFFETFLKSMQKEFDERKEGYDLCIKTSLVQLLIFMNRNSSNIQDNDIDYINSAHKTVSEITAFINKNYQEDITLLSVSQKFFISPYYLSRIFKKNTGFKFIEYLNGIRIKEAQNLMRKTDKSISEISEMVGYNSATHFGRIFKSITGTTPLNYKQLHQKRNM